MDNIFLRRSPLLNMRVPMESCTRFSLSFAASVDLPLAGRPTITMYNLSVVSKIILVHVNEYLSCLTLDDKHAVFIGFAQCHFFNDKINVRGLSIYFF